MLTHAELSNRIAAARRALRPVMAAAIALVSVPAIALIVFRAELEQALGTAAPKVSAGILLGATLLSAVLATRGGRTIVRRYGAVCPKCGWALTGIPLRVQNGVVRCMQCRTDIATE